MKSLILTSTKDKLGQKQRAMLHVKGQAGAGDHQHVGSPGWRGGQTPRTPKEGAGAVDSRATAMWMVPGPPTRGHETHTLGLPAASGLIRPFHRGLLGTVPTPPTVPRNEGDRGWGTSSPVPTDQVPPTKETGPLSQDPAHIPGLAGTWPMFRSRPRPSQGALALLSLHCTQRRGRSTEHISTRSHRLSLRRTGSASGSNLTEAIGVPETALPRTHDFPKPSASPGVCSQRAHTQRLTACVHRKPLPSRTWTLVVGS